jgi:hypothetical protein
VGSCDAAARAFLASRCRLARSLISAFASAPMSFGGTRRPVFGGIVSGIAPAVVDTTGSPCAIASASAIPYPSKRDARTNTSAAKHSSMIRSGGTAPSTATLSSSPLAEMSASSRAAAVRLRVRSPAMVRRHGRVVNRSKCRDQHIVSLIWYHRSDREKPDNGVVATTRGWDLVIPWSNDGDALSLDVVISDHSTSSRLARNHDARGSRQRCTLALAKKVRLPGIETGIVGERLVHQRDKRRSGSEDAGFRESSERKTVEDNRTSARTADRVISAIARCAPFGNGKPFPRSRTSTSQPSRRSSWMMRRS